jgi:hypothetical protein
MSGITLQNVYNYDGYPGSATATSLQFGPYNVPLAGGAGPTTGNIPIIQSDGTLALEPPGVLVGLDWQDVLVNGNFSGGSNPTLSVGDQFLSNEALKWGTVANPAIGTDPTSLAIGPNANCGAFTEACALGRNATNTANKQMKLGKDGSPGDFITIDLGFRNTLLFEGSIVIGAWGFPAVSTFLDSIAIGRSANSQGQFGAIAFGRDSIGGTLAGHNSAIGFGYQASATNANAIAFGPSASASGVGSISFGQGAVSTNTNGMAFGPGSLSTGTNGMAIGEASSDGGFAKSCAFGPGAICTATQQMMLGISTRTVVCPGSLVMPSVVGTASATGFLQVSTCAGPPTGIAADASIVYDSTDNIFYGRAGGVWVPFETGSADTWASVLVAGNTSGGTNPTISTGDSLRFVAGIRIGGSNIGTGTTGTDCISIGAGASGLTQSAISIGSLSQATGIANSIAIGVQSNSSGSGSISFGSNSNSSGSGSISFGNFSNDGGFAASVAFGPSALCNANNQIRMNGDLSMQSGKFYTHVATPPVIAPISNVGVVAMDANSTDTCGNFSFAITTGLVNWSVSITYNTTYTGGTAFPVIIPTTFGVANATTPAYISSFNNSGFTVIGNYVVGGGQTYFLNYNVIGSN